MDLDLIRILSFPRSLTVDCHALNSHFYLNIL